MSDPKLYAYEVTPTYDEAYDPPEYFGNMISMREASVGERLGWETCETCRGAGAQPTSVQFSDQPCVCHLGRGEKDCTRHTDWKPCPDCVDGWTPSDELVERAAKKLWREHDPRSKARAVLLEQARWIGEQ